MNKIVLFTLFTVVLIATGYVIQKNSDSPSKNTTEAQEKPIVQKNNTINLSNKDLQSIPAYVFDETGTEELDVSNNNLTGSIQAEIRHLSKLKILNLSNNLMTGIPAEIGQLQQLEILDLSNNKITGLPYEIGNLKNLKILNLSGNNYSQQDLDIIKKTLPRDVDIVVK